MKNFISFLLVFVLVNQAPFPAYAQSDPVLEVQNINTCYTQVFASVSTSFEKKTRTKLIIDENLKLKLLKALIPPKDVTASDKLVSWGVAAAIYTAAEMYILHKVQKVKPQILSADQAVQWERIDRAGRIEKLTELAQKVPELQRELLTVQKNPVAVAEAAKIVKSPEAAQRVRAEFEEVITKVKRYDSDLVAFENRTLQGSKLLKIKYGLGYWALQFAALTLYIWALETFPEVRGLGPNRFPTSLRTLHDSTSMADYQIQLATEDTDIYNLRNFLKKTCTQALAQNMDMWIEPLVNATPEEIVFALAHLPPPSKKK